MNFILTDVPDTVVAYNVTHESKPIGLVFLRDLYWHGSSSKGIVTGGNGFVHGRGYESQKAAATALVRTQKP